MGKRVLLAAFLLVVLGPVLAEDKKPSAFTDTYYGFTINAPEQKKDADMGCCACSFWVPSGTVSDQVQVLVQPFPTDFMDRKKQQDPATHFTNWKNTQTKMGWEVKSEKELEVAGRKARLLEAQQGKHGMCELRLFVYDSPKYLYMVIAAADEKSFAADKAILQASIDSFKLDAK